MSFSSDFLKETVEIVAALDTDAIEAIAAGLAETREKGGRLFVLGVGGSAGHAGHAVNDFRKICGIEAYAPTDNVSELTARTNDEGWETVFAAWLKGSRIGPDDALLIFSVGGGDKDKNISVKPRPRDRRGEVGRRQCLWHRRPPGRLHGRQRRRRASSCRRSSPSGSRRTPRGWRRSSGICSSATRH